jgi:hypothetical protein
MRVFAMSVASIGLELANSVFWSMVRTQRATLLRRRSLATMFFLLCQATCPPHADTPTC